MFQVNDTNAIMIHAVALLTAKIKYLAEHMKGHKKVRVIFYINHVRPNINVAY